MNPLPSRARIPASLVAVFLGVVLYYRFIWGSVSAFVRAIDFNDQLFADFVVYYYEMGRAVFTSGTPADGFYYSPAFAVALGVFSSLDPEPAMWIWGAILAVSACALAYTGYRAAAPARGTAVAYFFIFLTSFPLLHNLKWGQASLVLTLLVITALLAIQRKRLVSAGLLLAGAVAVKYYPLMFLVPLLLRGRWRAVTAAVAGMVLLMLLLPVLVLGWEPTVAFYRYLLGETRDVQVHAGGPNSQYAANVLMRLLPGGGEWGQAGRIAVVAAGFLLAQFNILLLFLLRTMEEQEFHRWGFVLLFLTIPFVISTSWPHYLVFIPFCQLFLFSRVLETGGVSLTVRRTLSGLLGVSVLLSSVFAFQLAGSWEEYNGWGLLFWSVLLMLVSSYVLLVPRAVRQVKQAVGPQG